MLSAEGLLVFAACLSFFAGTVLSQETQWVYDIPPEEAAALASIVEDIPEDVVSIQAKDWLSPEYPLIYKVALPIPPIKQPTKYVDSTFLKDMMIALLTMFYLQGHLPTPSRATISNTMRLR